MSTRIWGTKLLALGLLLIGLCAAGVASAATWYFSPSGSDSAAGTSSAPWVNPGNHNSVYQPGDVLSVGPGVYTPTWGWQLTASGSPAGGYITMQCAPNHASRIVVTSPWMSAIIVTHGASYWDINGCDVSASGMNGSAIGIDGQFSAPFGPLTHIIVENNIVHDSSCGGIAAAGNTNGGQALDYLIIRNNVSYGNAKTASYDCSGISIYEPKAYDQAPGYHLLVQQNVSFNNFDCDNCHTVTTDGNGIILDDFASSHQSSGTPYQPATLVENNLTFNNGGMGIHSFFSENITFRNNTAWGDVQDPQHCSGGYEIGAEFSSNIQFYNNLAEATRATICNSPVYALEIYGGGISTGISIAWNLAYGPSGHDIVIADAPAVSLGHGNWQGSNPKLIGPFRPTTLPQLSQIFAAFLPAKGSYALAPYGGSVAVSPANDLLGNPRRTKGTADLGAIQVGP